MFIISIIFFTTVFANSYEKYIDLLPEEEKQVFLDHVARRVMDNVDSKEVLSKNLYSTELTDDQLKEHNDFVQSVLKQESEQMRRNKGDQLKTELKVKGLADATDNKAASDADKIAKQGYESEEANFTATTAEKTNGTVQKRSIPSDDESAEKAESRTEVHDIIVSSNFKDLTAVSVTTESTLNTEGNKATVGTTEALPARTVQQSYSNSEESDSAIQTTTSTTETIDASATKSAVKTQISTTVNFGSQKSEKDSDNHEEDTTKNEEDQITNTTAITVETTTVNSKESEEIAADIETTSVNSILSTTLSDDGTTQAAKIADNVTTGLPEAKSVKQKERLKGNKEEKASEFDNTTKKNTEIESTTVGKINNTLQTTTNLPLKGLTPKNTHITSKKPKKIKSKSSKIRKVDNPSSNSTKKVKHKKKLKVKDVDEEKDFALIQKNIFIDTLKKDQECGIQSCHRYRVYEVPEWPVSVENQRPFLRSKEPMIDQPYFVPIYNYSPNYAYYNPENRRGHNTVEENSIEMDALREGVTAKTPEFEIDLDGLISKFGKYSKKTNHNKIAEILLKNFKNNKKHFVVKTIKIKNEEVTPLNKGKNSLKTQIKQIRDMIYQNKHLKQSNRHKKEMDNDIKILDLGNILDNFFKLTKPKHITKGKQRSSLNSKVLKHIFGNNNTVKVISLTPTAKFRNKYIKRPNKNKKLDEENKTVGREVNKMNNMIKKKKEEKPEVKNIDAKFNSYMNVLKELIVQDNNALVQYDWLSTAVQIHGALSKLQELINRVQNSETVHPADLQILKYAVYLHKFATEIRQANHYDSKLRNKLALPKNMKRKERFHVVKEKGLLNRVWLLLRTLMPNLNDQDELLDLNQFLMDVEDGLFDLHEALKNIAIVTKFKNQNWYRNLKDLYLNTDDKQLKEVLLHISFARLVDLIEFSCRNGLEDGFVEFMKTHETVAKRTLEEILFVMQIVEEINSNTT